MAQQEMNSGLPIAILAAGLMALTTGSVNAEPDGSNPKHPDAQKYQWRQVAEGASVSEYRKIYRHNKRVLWSTLSLYSQSAAESIGLSEEARQLTGVAAGVAASLLTNRDIKFRLNDKKTFAFEVRNPAENDRALFFNYKLKW